MRRPSRNVSSAPKSKSITLNSEESQAVTYAALKFVLGDPSLPLSRQQRLFAEQTVRRLEARAVFAPPIVRPTPPPPPPPPPAATAPPPPPPRNIKEAKLAVFAQLDDAIALAADAKTPTADDERVFERYQKVKALAVRPGTDGEGEAAVRRAVLDAVKLVF